MFMNPDLGTQLARQQQRQMLAAAERRQHGGIIPSTPGTTAAPAPVMRLRRLAAVIGVLLAWARAARRAASTTAS
jgi:hypothetical protein